MMIIYVGHKLFIFFTLLKKIGYLLEKCVEICKYDLLFNKYN